MITVFEIITVSNANKYSVDLFGSSLLYGVTPTWATQMKGASLLLYLFSSRPLSRSDTLYCTLQYYYVNLNFLEMRCDIKLLLFVCFR
jgi:hypothetical protein